MKLARFDSNGVPQLGAVVGDAIVPLRNLAPEFATMRELASSDRDTIARLSDLVARTVPEVELSAVRLLAPIERPGKYLGIGMNYADHMKEAERLGVKQQPNQTWFNKQTTCVVGPYDDIEPGVTEKLDYEVELGVVIGSNAKSVSAADAHRHVFGYFVANDVSARDWQFHSQTFMMGKSFDTHGPIGPWIVTADEVPDPHVLGLRCLVNGELRQESNTSKMISNIWDQIAYLSTAFTLETGDLLATGTPEGVGVAMSPPQFLKRGDVIRCEVDGVGAIENKVA